MATPLETSLFSGVALQPFILEPKESCAVRWTRWLSRFKTLLLAGDIKDPTKKSAILLIYGGGGRSALCIFFDNGADVTIVNNKLFQKINGGNELLTISDDNLPLLKTYTGETVSIRQIGVVNVPVEHHN